MPRKKQVSLFLFKRYAANEFAAGEHGGTHMDAPQHFERQGKYVADIELEKLIVPCKYQKI